MAIPQSNTGFIVQVSRHTYAVATFPDDPCPYRNLTDTLFAAITRPKSLRDTLRGYENWVTNGGTVVPTQNSRSPHPQALFRGEAGRKEDDSPD